jgi:two-component system, chemotaxis family, chemotaxis protein CheY
MSDIIIDPNAKILIVDDMDSVRTILNNILTDMGFQNIIEAANGRDAMAAFLEETESLRNIDIIISDINMPIMNGIELLKAVRSHYFGGDVPFIIVTTEQEKEIVVECIQAGASNYIIKPFDKEDVVGRVTEAYQNLTF